MNPLINLMHLKFFCDAVANSSISESAKINFVTQSTVSQAIIKLEIALKTKLLVHFRHKFQVTEEGQILFQEARHVFKAIQDLNDKIQQQQETITGVLKFMCTNSLGMSFIAPFYQKMQENLPHVQMNIKLGNLNTIRNTLRQNETEFAVVVYDQSLSQFAKVPLKKGSFHLYENTEAPHHQLKEGILVDFIDGMYVAELQEQFLQINHYPLTIQVALGGWEVVARFIEKRIGVGFLPDYIANLERYPNFRICPIDIPNFEYEICAIHNKGEKLSRAAHAFLDQF